jgi:hypothetical protein
VLVGDALRSPAEAAIGSITPSGCGVGDAQIGTDQESSQTSHPSQISSFHHATEQIRWIGNEVAEIVVTAEERSELLRDVSVPTTAIAPDAFVPCNLSLERVSGHLQAGISSNCNGADAEYSVRASGNARFSDTLTTRLYVWKNRRLTALTTFPTGV